MTKELTCRDLWAEQKRARIADLRKLWKLYNKDSDASDPELGNLNEYGLCFDYVAPETFRDQLEGYWRYQLSTGGPGDEFRFYSSSPSSAPYRMTYVFLDWNDGHERALRGRDRVVVAELWQWFADAELTLSTFDKASPNRLHKGTDSDTLRNRCNCVGCQYGGPCMLESPAPRGHT